MSKKDKDLFVVDFGTYPFELLVCFGEDRGPMYRYLLKNDVPEEYVDDLKNHSFGVEFSALHDDKGTSILWLTERPNTPYYQGLLSHEVYHAVCNLFDYIGLDYNKGSEEAFAYMIGYLTEEIYKRIL